MTDELDQLTLSEEFLEQKRQAARPVSVPLPTTHCTYCGDELDSVRKAHQLERCFDCQQEFELRGRGYLR